MTIKFETRSIQDSCAAIGFLGVFLEVFASLRI